jgi:hypothetical protein
LRALTLAVVVPQRRSTAQRVPLGGCGARVSGGFVLGYVEDGIGGGEGVE